MAMSASERTPRPGNHVGLEGSEHRTRRGRRIRLAVLTADYLMSDNEPNPSARRGKQACLTLVYSYHAIGNVVFESCGETISMKISAIGSYRQLD